jgi:hypothetical protein
MSGYRVGVELALHPGNVQAGLAAISAAMLGMHGQVGALNRGFASMRGSFVSMIGGIASVMAGGAILKEVMHVESAAEALVHAETTLRAALPPTNRVMDMRIAQTAAYAEAANNLNTTLSENVEHMHDLYNVVQDMKEAAHLLPLFNKLSNAFAFVTDEGARGHGADAKQIARAARAFELAGRTTPETMGKVAQEYVRAVIGLRGRVNANMLLQAVQTAGAGRYGWSDEFLAGGLPALLNVMPSRAGNSLYHMYNNLYGGVASSYAQATMQEKWGLHSTDDEVRDPVTHKFQGFKVGSVFEAQLLAKDPQKWALKYLDYLKTVKKVNIDSLETMRDVVGEIARGNKLLGAIMDEYLLPNASRQLMKERANIEKVGKDALAIMDSDDSRMAHKKFAAQWENFEQALGKSIVPTYVSGVLAPLSKGLSQLTQVLLHHPVAAKMAMEAITGLGIALVGLGSLAITGALVSLISNLNLLAPALSFIAGPAARAAGSLALLGLIAYQHRDDITAWANNFSSKFEGLSGFTKIAVEIGAGLAIIRVGLSAMRFALTGSPLGILLRLAGLGLLMYDNWSKVVGVFERLKALINDSALMKWATSNREQLKKEHPDYDTGWKWPWRTYGARGEDLAGNPMQDFMARRRVAKTIPEAAGTEGGGEKAATSITKTETKTYTISAPVSVQVNVAGATQAPAAVGQAVGGSVAAQMRAAMGDVAQ